MRVRVHTFKVFTRDRSAGNAAAVVPDALRLAPAELEAVARASGAPVTAFVFPSPLADAPCTIVSALGRARS